MPSDQKTPQDNFDLKNPGPPEVQERVERGTLTHQERQSGLTNTPPVEFLGVPIWPHPQLPGL